MQSFWSGEDLNTVMVPLHKTPGFRVDTLVRTLASDLLPTWKP